MLDTWLEARCARRQWDQTVRNIGVLTCYSIGEAVALVMRYGTNRNIYQGWDIFVPSSLDTRIDKTLETADRALGVKGLGI